MKTSYFNPWVRAVIGQEFGSETFSSADLSAEAPIAIGAKVEAKPLGAGG
jgi:hypothetical protein